MSSSEHRLLSLVIAAGCRRRRLPAALILLVVGLVATGLASAQGRAPTAGPDGVALELRRLHETVAVLLEIVGAWRDEARQAEVFRAAGELDRAIAFLDAERRQLVVERDGIERDHETLRQEMEDALRRRDRGAGPSLADLLQSGDPAERLQGQELQLYRYQQRIDHLDVRIQEVDATLAERRAWRAALSGTTP